MTVNEAYFVATGATVTLNYIPVLTPGLYDTFPGTPDKRSQRNGPIYPGNLSGVPGGTGSLSGDPGNI